MCSKVLFLLELIFSTDILRILLSKVSEGPYLLKIHLFIVIIIWRPDDHGVAVRLRAKRWKPTSNSSCLGLLTSVGAHAREDRLEPSKSNGVRCRR